MTDRHVAELLRDHPVPDQSAAEERAWRVLNAAFAERRPAPRRSSRPARVAIATAALAALLGVAFTPPGDAVSDWIRDAIRPGRQPSRPALTSLPATGRVLVNSRGGTWIVQRDGSTRRLGDYGQAGWSPAGLFVAATRGRRLVALDPRGSVRWSLARSQRVSRPAWSPDGYRIAYLSGASLRVVAGDGTGDRFLVRYVASTGPVWRPGPGHALTYVPPDGGISVRDTDSRRLLWRSPPGPVPTQLAWTLDGKRLLALGGSSLRVFGRDGALLSTVAMPAGTRAQAMAVRPGAFSVAVVRQGRTGRSEVVSLPLRARAARSHRLFAGDGRFTDLAWSPAGGWLLIAWRDADQWLFIRSTAVRKVDAVSNITRQFDPGGRGQRGFPRIAGWCCTR